MKYLTNIRPETVTRIELGCGSHKRAGFFGIDILQTPDVDLLLDLEKEKLPFADNSIDYIYSSHVFEHLTMHPIVLQEIMRVAKPDATVEIWTPYGKSNDGILFTHVTFLTETSYKHITYEYNQAYLGDKDWYLLWEQSHYNLYPGIVEQLWDMDVPLEFALEHWFNIALEWGVTLRVKKNSGQVQRPQVPKRLYSYGRDKIIESITPPPPPPTPLPPPPTFKRKVKNRVKRLLAD